MLAHLDGKWWTLIAAATGVFMLLLDVTIVNVALPDIQRQLHASLPDLQWVIDAYALSLAALLLTAGSLADLLGRRIVFASGVASFIVASLLCGVAHSPLFLALARAAQGVGGGVMFATSLALIAQAFRGPSRGVAFGVFGAISGIAVAVGPVLGGALTSGLSWRWIFFVNIPIGVAVIAITLLRVEESRDPLVRRPDWLGFLSFSSALGALVYGLIQAGSHRLGSTRVLAWLIAAALLLLAFVAVERWQREPMFNFGLLRGAAADARDHQQLALDASASRDDRMRRRRRPGHRPACLDRGRRRPPEQGRNGSRRPSPAALRRRRGADPPATGTARPAPARTSRRPSTRISRTRSTARFPLIQSVLSTEDWRGFTKSVARAQGIKGAAVYVPWIVDGATIAERKRFFSVLPAPIRLINRLLWEPRYRKR